jgi:hypothetical protein
VAVNRAGADEQRLGISFRSKRFASVYLKALSTNVRLELCCKNNVLVQ